MKNQTRKKVILWLAALVLLVTSCATAFASPGDRTIRHASSVDWNYNESIDSVFRMGDGFGVIAYEDGKQNLLKYADTESEPEIYLLRDNHYYDPFGETEETEEAQMTGEAAEGTEPEAGEPADEAEIQFEAKPETAEPAAEDGAAAEEKQEDPEAADGEQPAVEGLLSLDDIDWSDEALNDETAQSAFPEGEYYPADGEFPEGFQDEHETSYYTQNWFVWNGELYGIAVGQDWNPTTGEQSVEGVKLKHYKLEDGQATEEDADLPEWDYDKVSGEVESYGSFYLNDICVAGDTLIGQTWGAGGNVIMTVDLKTGSCSTMNMSMDVNVIAFTAGPEGSVLLGIYDWNTQKGSIIRKNLSDGKEETIKEFENGSQSMGLCYDAETDTLYVFQSGELWKAPMADLTKLEAVNDCPLTDCHLTVLPKGFVLAWNSSNILLRNTDPSVRGTTMLHVEDNTGYNQTMSETVFSLNEKRGDLSVVIRQQYEWMSGTNVLTDMMNKDSSTDIYVLPYEGTDFNALKKRGYLADLSDNAEIAESVNRMYPYIQDAMKQDGKIICVPVGLNGQTMGFNYKAWSKIGGTEEELPKTWDEFLDWLEKLPERLAGTEVKLTEDEYMADSLSGMLFSNIVYEYQIMKDSKGEELVFNTPLLRKLLDRVNNFDFRALGLKSWTENDGDNTVYYNENGAVLSPYTMSPMGQDYEGYGEPMPLSLEEGEDPIIPVQIYVACVNPFSEHAAEAKEFLALAMDNLEVIARYSFFADQTEPLRDFSYEQQKKMYEKYRDLAVKDAEKAEEGEEKIQAEAIVKSWDEDLERLEKDSWRLSPERIERYQKILPFCKVLDHDFQREVQNTITAQDAQLMGGEEDDNIDIENFLNLMDQKMQMIRDEGK